MAYDLTYNDDEISQWNGQKGFEVKIVDSDPVMDYQKYLEKQEASKKAQATNEYDEVYCI